MKMLKTLVIYVSIILLPLSFQSAYATEKTLTILNWSDYLDPDLVHQFEQQYQAKVVEVYYGSDEQRTEMLLNNDAQHYDLILSSGYDLNRYIKRGWLAELKEDKLPTLQYINPKWRNAFPGSELHSVPYFWGTLGIVYRSDLIKEPISHWHQIYQPTPSLQGKIGMIGDSRDLIGMGLKSLGYSANSEDSSQINEVAKLLIDQKKSVRSYVYMSIDEDSPILSGEIIASMAYNGDALMVQEYNENLRFVVPEEGGAIWVDYMTMGANAKEPELAYAFLNFINEPKNAAQLAQFVYYASPNNEAEKLLPKEFLNDKSIYPDQETLNKSEYFRPLSARTLRKRNNISINILE